jgi:beta-glucosidase
MRGRTRFNRKRTENTCTRRGFLGAASGATAALMAGNTIAGPATGMAASDEPVAEQAFPKGFWWGAATAAYQVEGAVGEDGRKPSVWDTFSHTPGRIRDGQTGDVACDHYHRYEDDVKLMAELGVKHYRFSISWPRIVPDGRGAVNEKGVDFYRRLVDALLAHGITPHATLFHWDSPQALEDRYGSWQSREIAKDFADYCSATVQRLGDRLTHWMTINEIACFTFQGYGTSTVPPSAPGTMLKSRKELSQTVHHALLAHGLGCQAIRAASPGRCHVSLVDNFQSFIPVIETPENIAAVRRAFVSTENNGVILVPALTGRYDPQRWAELGADAPEVQPGDLETICQPLDALGFNIYTGSYVRAAENAQGFEELPLPKGYPQMHMSWLNFLPESLYWGVRMVSEALGKKNLPIYVAENGCATDDEVTPQGEVLDTGRILYMRAYLRSAQRAIAEGYPLQGYFHWSLMDNFEWSSGYSRRFGLTRVDYSTQKRIPKLSFRWYQRAIRENRVV